MRPRRVQRLEEAGSFAPIARCSIPRRSGSASPGWSASASKSTRSPISRSCTARSRRGPQIVECLSVTGDSDYQLRVVARGFARVLDIVDGVDRADAGWSRRRDRASSPNTSSVRGAACFRQLKARTRAPPVPTGDAYVLISSPWCAWRGQQAGAHWPQSRLSLRPAEVVPCAGGRARRMPAPWRPARSRRAGRSRPHSRPSFASPSRAASARKSRRDCRPN